MLTQGVPTQLTIVTKGQKKTLNSATPQHPHIFNTGAVRLAKGVEKVSTPMNQLRLPHLSKRLSDLKHNGTQEKAPFPGTVINTLSPGVIGSVASVSSKNHLLTG